MRRLALFVLAAALAGCNPDVSYDSNVGPSTAAVFVDHGNGVLYFKHTGGDFANALSIYLGQHPMVRITAIAGDGNGVRGRDRGYFVTFEERDAI